MRTKIVLGCAAVALAAAGCGEAKAGHQNAGGQHSATSTATSTVGSDQPTTAASSTAHPTRKPTVRAPVPPASTAPAKTTAPVKTVAPSTDPATTAPAGPSSTAAVAAGRRCHTSDLWAVFQPLGAAAGNQYGKILLTNHSGASCTVYGYGGIGLVNSGGAVPTRQIRDTATPPVTITLAPGDHAFSQLHWSDVSGMGESQTRACEPQASALQVIPPDETRPLDAHWPGSPACEHGQIRQTAYRAGTGPASGG